MFEFRSSFFLFTVQQYLLLHTYYYMQMNTIPINTSKTKLYYFSLILHVLHYSTILKNNPFFVGINLDTDPPETSSFHCNYSKLKPQLVHPRLILIPARLFLIQPIWSLLFTTTPLFQQKTLLNTLARKTIQSILSELEQFQIFPRKIENSCYKHTPSTLVDPPETFSSHRHYSKIKPEIVQLE